MVEIERAGHWTGQLEWLPTDRFAKSAPDWAAPEMLGRALSAEARPFFIQYLNLRSAGSCVMSPSRSMPALPGGSLATVCQHLCKFFSISLCRFSTEWESL